MAPSLRGPASNAARIGSRLTAAARTVPSTSSRARVALTVQRPPKARAVSGETLRWPGPALAKLARTLPTSVSATRTRLSWARPLVTCTAPLLQRSVPLAVAGWKISRPPAVMDADARRRAMVPVPPRRVAVTSTSPAVPVSSRRPVRKARARCAALMPTADSVSVGRAVVQRHCSGRGHVPVECPGAQGVDLDGIAAEGEARSTALAVRSRSLDRRDLGVAVA